MKNIAFSGIVLLLVACGSGQSASEDGAPSAVATPAAAQVAAQKDYGDTVATVTPSETGIAAVLLAKANGAQLARIDWSAATKTSSVVVYVGGKAKTSAWGVDRFDGDKVSPEELENAVHAAYLASQELTAKVGVTHARSDEYGDDDDDDDDNGGGGGGSAPTCTPTSYCSSYSISQSVACNTCYFADCTWVPDPSFCMFTQYCNATSTYLVCVAQYADCSIYTSSPSLTNYTQSNPPSCTGGD